MLQIQTFILSIYHKKDEDIAKFKYQRTYLKSHIKGVKVKNKS